jgi:antitoxin MazE
VAVNIAGVVDQFQARNYDVVTFGDNALKSKIISIGNSQGIRIPKPILEQTGLSGEVELVARDGVLLVRAVSGPRAAWAEAFRTMAAKGDDQLVDAPPASSSRWDGDEWVW